MEEDGVQAVRCATLLLDPPSPAVGCPENDAIISGNPRSDRVNDEDIPQMVGDALILNFPGSAPIDSGQDRAVVANGKATTLVREGSFPERVPLGLWMLPTPVGGEKDCGNETGVKNEDGFSHADSTQKLIPRPAEMLYNE
jgi:hypothetical protein